ncbi:MAG: TonB-dependent siderophore receptor [Aquabacterium sp.]
MLHRHSRPVSRACRPALPRAHALSIAVRAALVCASLAGVAAMPPSAHAQGSASPASTSDEVRHFDIAAGPLEAAIARFARTAGINVSYPAELLAGRTTRGLVGQHSISTGFRALLAGSGLEPVVQPGGGYSLRKAAPDATGGAPVSATSMPEVRISASTARTPETAWGPVDGYRATRSASATKMDVPLLETPQQVSTIGSAQIRDQAVASVSEAVRYSAGVRPADYGITDDDVAVRGFYLTGTGLYRDGMRLIHNGFMANLEPYGLERLEVVHGPASVLYGQSAPGGLINAVTKRPRADMLHEVGIELGSHGRRQATVDVGGALNEQGTLLGRFTALHRTAGTQWDHLRADRSYVAPALTLKGNRTTLTILSHFQEDKTGYVIPYYRNTPFGPSAEDINVNGPGSGHHKKTASIGYLLEHAFNDDLTLRHHLRYLDGENTRLEMRNRGLLADQRSMARLAMVRPDAEKTLVVDTHLETRLRHGQVSHQVLAGVDLYRSKLDWRIYSLNGAVAPIDLVNPVYVQPDWNDNYLSDRALAKNTQLGVYAQDQIKFGEQWVLSLGGRYDTARIDTDYLARASSAAPFATTRVDRRDDAWTGRAGLIHLAEGGLAPYISVSTSFQPPLTTVTAVDANGNPYEPERARQAEVGVRYAPPEAGYTVSAALFDLRKRNVRTPSTLNPRFDVQTGEVRSRGLELQGSGELGGGFSVIGAYTYLDAEVTRSNNALDLGERPGATPRHVASLWGKHKQGPLELALGARHISATPGELRATTAPLPMNDGYTLFDAMAAYHLGAWRLSLNVSNLADKQHKTQCNTFRGGAQFCALGFGREVRAAATYRF